MVVTVSTDRDILSQLARPTRLAEFSLDLKSCVAVYIINVLLVLFFFVMCIWVDLRVLKDQRLWIYSLIQAGQA